MVFDANRRLFDVIVVYEGIVSGGISVSSTIIVYIYASRLYVFYFDECKKVTSVSNNFLSNYIC